MDPRLPTRDDPPAIDPILDALEQSFFQALAYPAVMCRRRSDAVQWSASDR